MTTGIGTLGDLLPQPVRGDRIYGVVVGVVTDVDVDAGGQSKGVHQGLYRVKVKFPWLADTPDSSNWARVVTPMAGPGRGLYLPLMVDDEVAVMFAHGDPNHPIVIGALWNGTDKPPADVPPREKKFQYVLRSKSGHTVTLDDSDGAEKISIVDKTGKNQIVIDSSTGKTTIKADEELAIVVGSSSVVVGKDAVTVSASNFVVKAGKAYSLTTGPTVVKGSSSKLELKSIKVAINDDALEVM